MGNLKNENGEFQKFVAIGVDGNEYPLRLDRDENGKLRAQRRMATCLQKTTQAEYDFENVHFRKDLKKGRVTVFVDKDPLCTMRPTAYEVTKDFFYWDLPKVAELSIDKEKLINETLEMFQRPEDKVEWCL